MKASIKGSTSLPSPLDVVGLIRSGQRVFVHGGAATPNALLSALTEHAHRLKDVELIHLHTEGPATYADPEFRGHFKTVNLFVGANLRTRLDPGHVDYLPCPLSQIPRLFQTSRPIDIALLHLSLPDQNGFCSLGVSVDVARAAVSEAKILLAQINPRMPYVHGNSFIHLNDLDGYCEVEVELPEPQVRPIGEVELKIAEHVAGLVPDGACLQVGIGAVPNAVLCALKDHKHLGVHSEMWSDGILDLILDGAVDNSQKELLPGRTLSSFVLGSRRLYDFIHKNPNVVQLGSDVVNDPRTIAQNRRMIAINSAVEIDLTGQVCADSLGHRIISGVGGQADFIQGAGLSEDGKAIFAITSRAKGKRSRIVGTLAPGAGVVTTRNQVQFVVTEYGVADLAGKTLQQRAQALIAIAHPEDREDLQRQWSQRGK